MVGRVSPETGAAQRLLGQFARERERGRERDRLIFFFITEQIHPLIPKLAQVLQPVPHKEA